MLRKKPNTKPESIILNDPQASVQSQRQAYIHAGDSTHEELIKHDIIGVVNISGQHILETKASLVADITAIYHIKTGVLKTTKVLEGIL